MLGARERLPEAVGPGLPWEQGSGIGAGGPQDSWRTAVGVGTQAWPPWGSTQPRRR